MKRRAFLLGSAAAAWGLARPAVAQPETLGTAVSCLAITDVSPEVPVARLLALFDVLWDSGVPFTCLVGTVDEGGAPRPLPDDLSTLLFAYSLRGGGMEVASHVPGLATKSGYFQARAVHDANRAVQEAVSRHLGAADRPPSPQVVGCEDVDGPEAPSGVRSAGVSTLLMLPRRDGPVSSELWPNGTVRVFGGRRIDLGVYSGVETRPEAGVSQRIFYLSAKALAGMSVEDVSARARLLADDLLASERSGRSSLQLVSELPLRDSYRFRRHVAIHLVTPGGEDASGTRAVESFRAALGENGIVASSGRHAGVFRPEGSARYWLPVGPAGEATESAGFPHELIAVTSDCHGALFERPEAPDAALPPGHALAFGEMGRQGAGFDECGILWLPCLDVPDPETAAGASGRIGQTGDVVVSIRPEALATPLSRRRLLEDFLSMTGDGVTRITSVESFARAVAPAGAEIEWQRRTLGALPRMRARKPGPRARARARQVWMQDAETAWTYFSRNTHPDTGLCPASLDFAPGGGNVLFNATMWDVGSQINGLIAAVRLGLVSAQDFDRNISRILDQIRGRRSHGRLLPQGWIRTDRHRIGNQDFDASDAGRLLSALDNLRRHGGYDERLRELVGSWDLDQVIVDGEIHSVTDGRLHSAFRSHSAHYAARAFRRWGFRPRSPYEVLAGRSAHDGQVALIEAASWIGPLGAEPLLLEALELGMSPESAHLAEVLFAAQLAEHDETGRLVAVSEGPIDHPPWFLYQGLQLDAIERTWALDTVDEDARFRTPQFWRDNLVVSSKACYLWAAYKPHEHSDRLVALVRDKCRTEQGFASGVFVDSGRVMSTYTDLNTNGVILQSIARVLLEP